MFEKKTLNLRGDKQFLQSYWHGFCGLTPLGKCLHSECANSYITVLFLECVYELFCHILGILPG